MILDWARGAEGIVGIRRERVELVLAGRAGEVGIGPRTLSSDELEAIAADLTSEAGASIFATPDRLAVALGLTVVEVELPGGLLFACNGSIAAIAPQREPTDRNLLLLGAISQHALASNVGAHTLSDVCFLVAELAAPSSFVIRRGVSPVIQARHVPDWFLRAWERTVLAPSSRSCAG